MKIHSINTTNTAEFLRIGVSGRNIQMYETKFVGESSFVFHLLKQTNECDKVFILELFDQNNHNVVRATALENDTSYNYKLFIF